MTLKEKIADLNFYNLIAKLKDILKNTTDIINSLTKRVSSIENGSGGSGSQDLQQTLDNGSTASIAENTTSIMNFDKGNYITQFGNKVGDNQANFFVSSAGAVDIGANTSNGRYSRIILNPSGLVDNELQLELANTTVGGRTLFVLDNIESAGEAIIRVPHKVGDNILATTGDFAVANHTSVPLTNSDLNAAYPTAHEGFRVHCISISGGGIIYERVLTGWVKIPVETF